MFESLTNVIIDQVLAQFGADDELLKDTSEIQATREEFDLELNKYAVNVLACILGTFPSRLFLACLY